jgi:RNA polymerase-interacting CarD/CdnL/TRCF family regulator
MQLRVGDCVVHPSFGIGLITNLAVKRLSGHEARLYFEVNMNESTIWVPVETSRPSRLRPLTTREDLGRYRKLLVSSPAPLDDDPRKRTMDLDTRLKEGTFQAVCETVRDLTARSWKKNSSQGDLALLNRAQQNLYQEWSASAGVSPTEAADEVDTLLLKARQKYD